MVPLATRTLEMLAVQLPDAARTKAATLVAHRRVKDVVSTSSAIFATVQGSQPYAVEILEIEGDEGVDVFCSCPAYYKYGPCKHVYAAALEAVARADPGSRGGSRSGTHWGTRLKRVRHTEAEVDAPPPPRGPRAPVLYRVSVAARSDERPVAVACVEQVEFERFERTRARWRDASAPRAVSPTKLLRAGAANRLELRVLRELSLLEEHDRALGPGKIEVPPDRVGHLLRLLARTGLAFVVVSEARVTRLEDDSAVPYLVDFVRREDGSVVHVDAELTRGDERVSPRDASLLLADGTLLHAGRLCRVAWRDPEESAWLNEILAEGAMAVPVAELERFEGDVLRGGYFPAAVLPDIDVERDVPPQPLLVVHARKGRSHPRADVHFEYGSIRVAGRDTSRVALDEGDVRLIWRRMDEERRHFTELFHLPQVSPAKNDPAHDVRIAPSQLPDAVLSLLEAGWTVEVEGRRVYSVSSTSVRVSSGQDWFDVEGIVDFDGVEVPLPDVVASTRSKDRFVRLENGGVGIVPNTFDDAWGLLEHLGRRQGNGLRFARSQGWLIDALLSARGDVRGDAGYDALRGGIAEFEGIADHEEPPGFQGTLRPYQRRALGWFAFLRRFGLGGCLADDMGLGKTIQVLALLIERKNAGIEAPSLVVAPRSVVHNWVREAARFAPGLRVVEYGGAERAGLLAKPRDVDLIATSYGVLRRDSEPLAQVAFDYVVLDEAQMVKNPSSRGSKAARTLTAAHRLALTGTPVENRLTDLWAILEFACPGLLGSSSAFRGLVKATTVNREQRADLAAAIRPVLLRRTKEMVAPELPARTEQDLFCDLPEQQRALYDQLKAHYRSTLLAARARRVGGPGDGKRGGGNRGGEIGGKERMQILVALLRLRQAACHGLLADGDADAALSGKLDELVPMLEEATSEGHSALVFSQFTRFLGCARERLDAAGIPYLYLDGKTRNREALTRRFQEGDGERVFLISLKAGGTGLNLTAADYVFLLDPWWNPAVERQAIDRAHRIGQTRPVVAYRLIAADTVEERILELQQEKRELAAAIIDGNASLAADLTRDDLERLLR